MSSTGDAPRSLRPFCFRCGYDLTGLTLPRPCPECGFTYDPVRDAEAARAWFASARSLWWFVRPSRNPDGLFHVLHDAGSVRVARRRRFRWLLLPAILTFVTLLTGTMFVVEYDEKISYYEKGDPTRTPVSNRWYHESDRVFYYELKLFREGLFFKKPPSWVRVTEVVNRRVVFVFPDELDPLPFFLNGAPCFVLLLGYLPAMFVIRRRSGSRHLSVDRPEFTLSASSAAALTAPVFGAALWLFYAVVVAFGIATACLWADRTFEPAAYLVLGTGGCWAMAGIVGFPLLVSMDRARVVFPNRLWANVVLILAAVGVPVAVFCCVTAFL